MLILLEDLLTSESIRTNGVAGFSLQGKKLGELFLHNSS